MKVILFTIISTVILISINETILRIAKHKPSIVDDKILWSQQRLRIKKASDKATVLLGASRMQAGFDTNLLDKKDIIQLAISGTGSCYPAFKDIVENTSFNGTIILSVTEMMILLTSSVQTDYVEFYHKKFSVNNSINKSLSNILQSKFVFLNPSSSSIRLWGNIIFNKKLPLPYYVKTYKDRSQFIDFSMRDISELRKIKLQGAKALSEQKPIPINQWNSAINKWVSLVNNFKDRGGKPVFVYFPIDSCRWAMEKKRYPRNIYWNLFRKKVNTICIHFEDYPSLKSFKLPDTSHLDGHDKKAFTKALLKIVNE